MSKFNKSGNNSRGKGQGKFFKTHHVGEKGREALEKIDENCITIQNFKKYAMELDAKHDKFERLVKLSRDITIESKRIIFLLHSINKESKRNAVLSEAETRLNALIMQNWKGVALELQNEDPYLYHRAFSPGMQEFMEAFSFYNYLKSETFLSWDKYQQQLKYEIGDTVEKKGILTQISTILVPSDYILGLADVTGELMRKCINSLGEGDTDSCFSTCDIVRNLYSGFLMIEFFSNKEMSRKVFTLRQSLLKMEMVCYNIHVRGSEVPKHMLADVDRQESHVKDDESFN